MPDDGQATVLLPRSVTGWGRDGKSMAVAGKLKTALTAGGWGDPTPCSQAGGDSSCTRLCLPRSSSKD